MIKRFYSYSLLITLLILAGCRASTTVKSDSELVTTTNTTTTVPLDLISRINVATENPKEYEKVEFDLLEDNPVIKSLGNPFDYKFMNIIGKFTSPTGKIVEIPAFWYRDYNIVLDDKWPGTNPVSAGEPKGLETVVFKGDEHYRIRFLPEESGTWTYTINVRKDDVLIQELSGSLNVAENPINYKGVIGVEPVNKRNFIFEDGSTYIPIGENTGWYTNTDRKTYDYDVWFGNMSENGANATRVWMAPWSFALSWGKSYNDFTSRLNAAARLDRVINLAGENNIYLLLTLLNHGQFTFITDSTWSTNPWNQANGGILKSGAEFFYSNEAKEVYKSQLLYIIARWGYSDNIMAWELWNEVNWIENYSYDGYLWHKEISQFLKDNDPYHHMVTSSFKGDTNESDKISTIDFVNPHNYSYTDINNTLPARIDSVWNSYHKPVFQSEIGINYLANGVDMTKADPTGISIHQEVWAGMMGGGVGGAMNWWWDSWVHPNNLYYRFKGASVYANEMNLVGNSYNQLRLDNNISISDSKVGVMGYRIDNRLYAYFYDKNWRFNNPAVSMKNNVIVSVPFTNGIYTLKVFDTDTGNILKQEQINVTNNTFNFTFGNILNDIAIVVD